MLRRKNYFLLCLAAGIMLISLGKIAPAEPVNDEGFIDIWLVCGPFPNLGPTGTVDDHNIAKIDTGIFTGWKKDWLIRDGGEKKIAPKEGLSYEVTFPESIFWKSGKVTIKWEEYFAEDNKVNLLETFSNEELDIDQTKEHRVRFVVGYAYCVVNSDEEQKVTLAFGSDDGYKIWLNHQLVGSDDSRRGLKIDQDKFPVILKKGRNTLLVKVDQSIGGYGFALRFLCADGSMFIDDIDISH